MMTLRGNYLAYLNHDPLDDVCDREDKVVFPDLDAIDWKIAVEVHRCLDEYGKYGRSYGFMGFRLGNMRDPRILGGAYQYAQELAAKE